MTELMRLSLADGGQVLVDVDEHDPGVVRASRVGDVIHSSAESLEAALIPVCRAAAAAMDTLRAVAAGPDEIEIEFGVRLTAEAGAVISKAGAEGHMQVRLRWSAQPATGRR